MALVLQVVVTGLAAGAGYGLVAIGYALVYRLTGVVHFALGELIGLSVFVTLFLATGTGPVTRTNLPLGRLLPAVAGGLALAVGCGLLVYVVAVRPFLRRASMLGWIAGVVAVAFAVRGLLAATLSRQSYVFPDLIPFTRLQNGGVLSLGGGVTLPVRAFFVIGAGLGLAALAAGFLDRTRHGRAMQAVAEDATAARTIGLPIEWLRAAAFALAGGLAALAAVLQAPSVPVFADTGALIGLKGLVAALLARFGSPWKAFAAGLAVGVLETGASSLHIGVLRLGPAYGDVVPLAFALVLVAARYRKDQVEVVE